MMPKLIMIGAVMILAAVLLLSAAAEGDSMICRLSPRVFTMEPIGRVHKNDASAWIEIEPQFEEALSGLDDFSHVWVFWWFDRNDSPGNRRILKVHPRGDTRNPLTGVFATRAPVRPNLVALTLCRIVAVDGNRIRVAGIDAFDGTPVVDLKPYIPSLDRPDDVKVPDWIHRPAESGQTAPAQP